MRRWRVSSGRVLVEADAARGRFQLLGVDLQVERTYEPAVHSVEDDLYKDTYDVLGGEFRELCEAEDSWHGTVRHSHRVLFEGLVALADDDEPPQAEVDEAMGTHRSGLARVERMKQAAIDELANCPAAAVFLLQGPCRRLADRVVRYNDKASQQMLRLLDAATTAFSALLATVQRDAARELHGAATLLGQASRHMTFGRASSDGAATLLPEMLDELPRGPASLPSAARAELRIRLRSLLDAVEAMQRELLLEADIQDNADATLNASAYRSAAGQVERAAQVVNALDQHIADAP